LGSPISIDLPVLGGHTQQPPREVRLQLPGQRESVRPDTVDEVKDLPSRQFFSESSSTEFKDYEDDHHPEDSVFAFHRPETAPQDAVTVTSSTVNPTIESSSSGGPANMVEEAPIGGYEADHHRKYDASHPPPFSGRSNLNNGVFTSSTYGLRRRDHPDSDLSTAGPLGKAYPPTTATTMSTDVSSASGVAPAPNLNGGRFVRIPVGRPSTGRPSTARPSTTGSSYFTESEYTDSGNEHRRPWSRAVTDMTGDATVPDGVTTWGDGLGAEMKESMDDPADGQDQWYEEDSPYAEVRAAVSNLDDPDMPALTLRSWVLGMFVCLVVASANTFFYFRSPSPTIPYMVVQVVVYPMGKFLAWALPIREFTMPKWLGGFSFSLNPCPFNVKEHTVIAMMATVATVAPAGMNTLVVSDLWYHRPLGLGFSFLYILATQLTGLSLAGIARRYVVWPASMIWPGVLVMTTNLNTLHAESDPASGSMSRLRFFVIAGIAAFVYYFIPGEFTVKLHALTLGYLFTALSYFSYVCWGAPRNVIVNQLFGTTTGLGMGILTFDWTQIAWLGSPLANPWWAQVNIGIGFVLFYWIIVPALYYSNVRVNVLLQS
jgi:hypothetical protein